jgi:hypothetical protein
MPGDDQLRANNHVRLTACDALNMFLQRPRDPYKSELKTATRASGKRLGFFGHAFHAGTNQSQAIPRLRKTGTPSAWAGFP